jgi:hypothetical protein
MKGWEKNFQANGSPKQAGVAILIFNKISLKLKFIRRDKEGYIILIKRTIQEKIILVSIYTHQTLTHPISLNK